MATQPVMRVAPQAATLEPYRDQIATWIDDDHLLLTRVQELLSQQHGVAVAYTTLRRYVRQAGLWKAAAVDGAHGADAAGRSGRDGFRQLGTLLNPDTGQTPGGLGAWYHADRIAATASSGRWSIRRWRPPSKG